MSSARLHTVCLIFTLLSDKVETTSFNINSHVCEQIDVDELSQVSGLARKDVTVSSPTLVTCAVECLEHPNCQYFATSATQCGLLLHTGGLLGANLIGDDDVIITRRQGKELIEQLFQTLTDSVITSRTHFGRNKSLIHTCTIKTVNCFLNDSNWKFNCR